MHVPSSKMFISTDFYVYLLVLGLVRVTFACFGCIAVKPRRRAALNGCSSLQQRFGTDPSAASLLTHQIIDCVFLQKQIKDQWSAWPAVKPQCAVRFPQPPKVLKACDECADCSVTWFFH